MQTAWPLNVVTFLQSIHHKSIYIKIAQFLDEGFKTLILGLDFQSFKNLIEALYCLLLIYIAFAEAGKEIVIHLWTNKLFPNPEHAQDADLTRFHLWQECQKTPLGFSTNTWKVTCLILRTEVFIFYEFCLVFCMHVWWNPFELLRDRTAFPFLFSFFLFFFPISSTRKTVSWKMSALDIYSIILLIEILHMSTLISLNKKELYEEHVQNSYSDRKGSDKVYQGSYKKTCYLKLSLGRR